MSNPELTRVQPHDQVVHVLINRRALNDVSSHQLIDEVNSAAAAAPKLPLVLDMLKVEFTPSSVLGALVSLSNSMKLDGRRFILVHVDRRVRGTLAVTRLDKKLEMFETLDDAVASLARA